MLFRSTLDSERAIQSLTPLESALLARFGVTTAAEVSAANAAVDSDGDGMTDLEKILVENDPGYFKKNFKAELDESDASGITIRWKCVQGYTYTVVRDTSMFGTFGEAIFTATASQTGVMSYKDVDAASEVQYFYKVIQN